MTISLEEFLAMKGPCFDVRSPKEYCHAKIPGATNLALFSDVERAIVGTAYKQQGKDIAVRLGIKIVGPKLDSMLTSALEHDFSCHKARVYCWRGGMRSGFVKYFLETAGIASVQLKGGYKAFRRFALNTLAKPCKLFILGGFTGCGKTEVLQALKQENVPTVDLEAIACHKGSVYGSLDGKAQPSNEQFENELALNLFNFKSDEPIWVEDESRLIGRCQIPNSFYEVMSHAPLFILNSSKEARMRRILAEYGSFPREHLYESTKKLEKRLGGAKTKAVLQFIEQNAAFEAMNLLLDYYDEAYEHALSRHAGPIIRLSEGDLTPSLWAERLRQASSIPL